MPLLPARSGACGEAPAIVGDLEPTNAAPQLRPPTVDPPVPSDGHPDTPTEPPAVPPPGPTDWPRIAAPATALDAWQRLLTSHLAARPLGVSADGEAFPQTTVGDVRRVALLLSRELCRPRYDGANLAETRAAWRDAVARANALCAQLAWLDPYPENERFWLSDSLALAQRLAAVDVRRNALTMDEHGALASFVGDRGDPLTVWGDLRQFFLGRRTLRRGALALSYPDTTVGDVVQVAKVFDESTLRTAAFAMPLPDLRAKYEDVRDRWRAASLHVAELAASHVPADVYPENERFWLRDTKRLAIWLTVLRNAALPEIAGPHAQPVRP